MCLVFRQIEDQLHRADDAARLLGDEQRTLAARRAAAATPRQKAVALSSSTGS